MRNGIKYMIVIYSIIAILIYKLKPQLIFSKDKYKKFGVGPNKTIYNYHILLILLAFILFYIFEVMWLNKNNFL